MIFNELVFKFYEEKVALEIQDFSNPKKRNLKARLA